MPRKNARPAMKKAAAKRKARLKAKAASRGCRPRTVPNDTGRSSALGLAAAGFLMKEGPFYER